jgi:CHRD domain
MRRLISVGAAITAIVAAVPALAAAKTITRTATLSGKQEVPAADPNGSGKAVIRLNASAGTVCYSITVSKIAGSAAAHIHKGAKGKSGNVIIPLFQFAKPSSKHTLSGCVKHQKASLVKAIAAHPSAYYVNVHNAKYPNGAIRGQLH